MVIKTDQFNNIAIIGCGAMGLALAEALAQSNPNSKIHAFSRTPITSEHQNITHQLIDYTNEDSIEAAAKSASQEGKLDLVIVATGILHDGEIQPEKNIKDLTREKFVHIYEVNTVVPALIAKHFLPHLEKDKKAVFAALTARVGSVSDNNLGGWYSYRCSKAALQMVIKNASIEVGRLNKNAVIVSLHPGTVASHLSEPFQAHVAEDHLFKPEFAAEKLLEVIGGITPAQSGSIFAWDGEEIQP